MQLINTVVNPNSAILSQFSSACKVAEENYNQAYKAWQLEGSKEVKEVGYQVSSPDREGYYPDILTSFLWSHQNREIKKWFDANPTQSVYSSEDGIRVERVEKVVSVRSEEPILVLPEKPRLLTNYDLVHSINPLFTRDDFYPGVNEQGEKYERSWYIYEDKVAKIESLVVEATKDRPLHTKTTFYHRRETYRVFPDRVEVWEDFVGEYSLRKPDGDIYYPPREAEYSESGYDFHEGLWGD